MEPSEIYFARSVSNIKKIRLAQHIKQESLVKEVHYTKSQMSRLENGDRDTTLKTFLKIAESLSTHPAKFFED